MRRAPLALTAGLSLLVLTACGGEEAPEQETAPAGEGGTALDDLESGYSAMDPGSVGEATITATLVDPEGTQVGVVGMDPVPEGTVVSVILTDSGLEPGFHGLHLHGTGVCEPDSQSPSDPAATGDFLSAGGHLGVDEGDHGSHTGDLPSLYVLSTGSATLRFVSDAFTVDDVTDADGTAVMVHSGADNFANIPDRYAPEGPDQETLDTGDSGTRVACGVIE